MHILFMRDREDFIYQFFRRQDGFVITKQNKKTAKHKSFCRFYMSIKFWRHPCFDQDAHFFEKYAIIVFKSVRFRVFDCIK